VDRPKSRWERGVNENSRLYNVWRGATPIDPALKQLYTVVALHERGPRPSWIKLYGNFRVKQHLPYGRDKVNVAYTPILERIDTR
jgi:hypothetical protein